MSEHSQLPTTSKASLFRDRKFIWLSLSVAVVAVFEFLALAEMSMPQVFAIPFFSSLILVVGHHTLVKGVKALMRLKFQSINLLMLIAVCGAFYLGEYEEAAVVIVLYTLAERLEDFGVASSRQALKQLTEKIPKKADIKGKGKDIPVEKIEIGDILIIKPADMIVLDGEVVSGFSSIDESTITGEPLPKDKHEGDQVFGGTLNKQGYLEVRVTKLAKDSTLQKIVELTFEASQAKAETQKFIEKFSNYYTPLVTIVAIGIAVIPVMFFQQELEPWLKSALTLLVIACPCALVISTPISIYSAIGVASKKGVLVKGGKYLESLGAVQAIAMDKTKTLTYGKPVVSDVIPFGENTADHVLACAAGIEIFSEHPLAQGIVDKARESDIEPHSVENFQAVPGKGIVADCLVCYDRKHTIGSLKFIETETKVGDDIRNAIDSLHADGKTAIVVSADAKVEGVLAVTDGIKPESKATIAELQSMGIHIAMLTGDHPAPANKVAQELAITDVHAGLLPQDKAVVIKELNDKYQITAMVGDGVNDAPALALASVGVAMGSAGSDTAIEVASIAIMNDDLSLLPYLIKLGRKTIFKIKFNTFWAVAIKFVFIGLASFGLSNLALAILADVGVTIFVVLNSLRLLKFQTS